MRQKGRHGMEMEERFCFLVASYEATTQVYQLGLRTERQDQYSLGKPSHGVYLYKHVDVALKHAASSTFSGKHLIIFKVFFGKVKKVTPSLDWNRTPDPMISFDCHVSKDAVSHRDSLSQQILGSSVFLFDYNENQELNKRPRQCLPYAVVSFDPVNSVTPPKSTSPPVSPSKLPTGLMHGHSEHFRGCTVAERQGEVENATITFKHFTTQSSDNNPQPFGVVTSLSQQNELQNEPFLFIPQQLYVPALHTAESFNLSLPYFDGVSLQSYLGGITFPSNVEHLSPTNTSGGNTDMCGVTPKTSDEEISTIVFSSQLVKDPRLCRQEKNIQEQNSEQENGGSNEQACSWSKEEKTESSRTSYCEKQSVRMDEEQREDVFFKSSVDDQHAPDPNPKPKTENLPSIKLFKMKFQKYAAYFKMTEKERHNNIMSRENLTPEQKQLLINRINFYEVHYQRYVQGLLFQRSTETENTLCSSHVKPKNNKICLSTQEKTPSMIKENIDKINQSNVRPSIRSNVSNFPSTMGLVDTERYEVDMFSTDNDKITNIRIESTANTIQEKNQDWSTDPPEFYIEPQDGSVLQPVEVDILEQSFEQGPLLMNTSEKNKAIENKLDCEKTHWYSKQDQANDQAVSEGETSTSTSKSFRSETTLSSNMEESHEFELHNITAMNGENYVDIPIVNVSENNELSFVSAMRQKQQNQIIPEKQNREFKTDSQSDDNSEMYIVVKRGESSDNTIYSALYDRLKLNQLLPNLNRVNIFSKKSYLIPKDMDKTPVINQRYGPYNEILPNEDNSKAKIRDWQCEDGPQFMRKFKQLSRTTEKLSLSERFSKLRDFRKKTTLTVHDKKFTSYATAPTGDAKSDLAALMRSRDGGKGPINNNAKLIQLMARRYSEKRSLAKCQCLSRKCSKALGRETSKFSVSLPLKCSARSVSHVLRTALHIRKIHLQKAKKRYKANLASNKSSHFRALLSKKTVTLSHLLSCTTEATNTDKDDDSLLNLGVISRSSDPPRHHRDDESNQTDNTANISSEDHSCLSASASENKRSHDDGFMHVSLSKEQGADSDTQYTNNVCGDISRTLNHNIKKSLGELTLDFKVPVTTYEKEPERGTNNNSTCRHEQPSPVACSGSRESHGADGDGLKEENKLLQVTPQQPREEECDTKEISSDYNAGAYKDQGRSAQAVLNILAGITSSNKISSYTEKTQTDKTPELPRIINDDKTDGFCLGTVVDTTSAVSGVTTPLVDIVVNVSKTCETEANVSVRNNGPHNDANGTVANDKELSRDVTTNADQSSLKALKVARHDAAETLAGGFIFSRGNINHPSEPASSSQYQPAAKPAESSGAVNSQVEATADLNSEVITDAKEADIAVIKGDLHSAWRCGDKNSIPNMPETQLITKLRDYLTKFEFSFKRQESANDSVKESKAPMAWITLDSTAHKRQLLDIKHYNTPGLFNIKHGKDNTPNLMQSSTEIEEDSQKAKVLTETLNNPVTPTRPKTNKGCNQPKRSTSKRRRRNKEVNVSPYSTSILEPVQKHSHSHLLVNKNTDSLQTSTSLPKTQQHWMQNHTKLVQKNQIICSQSSGDLNGLSRQQGQVNQSEAEKANETTLYDEWVDNTYVQREFNVMDISSTLKLADHALSLAELEPLQLKCHSMLWHFICNFERDQQVSFNQSGVSRNLILEKYLDHPPAKVELKFEALNSLLELQMMMEAWQFVENKVNFLRRKPTFRSLLWYDPTLYGELHKGAVGFQQQSSLFSLFQQCLSTEGHGKLQEYHVAVSTLHQQLQDAPDTSYYMYLKSKRERLEIEAALRNPQDVKSFFLSVPIAVMINFGDSLESLEKTYRIVMTFVETPSDCLPGIFDVGKAEHLSILCRYLQEKMVFLKSCEHISKVSWFGLEHLLYDASKVLVWRESEHGMPNEVLTKYKSSNQQIVYGVTETGIALVNKMDQHPQLIERFQLTSQQHMDALRKYRNTQSGMSTNRKDRLNIGTEGGNKVTRRPNKRRATHPPLRCNDGGVTPYTQTNLAAQLGTQTPYTTFPPKSNSVHWKMAGRHAWDWNPPNVVQASMSRSEIRALLLSRRKTMPNTVITSVMNIQNNHVVRQQKWPPPLIMNPAAAERMNHPPGSGTELPKEQLTQSTMPMVQSCSFSNFPLDAVSVAPSAVSIQPFRNTLNQVPRHSKPPPINYPYFVFNGQTYSNVGSSVSTSVLDAEMQHHPHAV
ncbi:uncharacterized protein LOC113570045 isoform X2 [Electrophorus electricus]|nr:uncharacterized protein LOC113570045 isoform X2 [Electrophorus electricus]